jgi:protein involved in polysaccharide export with SLBB domain
MHVTDLIGKGQLLPNDVYLERADLYRHRPDGAIEILPIRLKEIAAGQANDILLQDLDSLHVYGTGEVERKKFVEVDGMVQKPGRYPLYDGMTAADLIFLAGNFTASAYTLEAEMARIDSLGATSVLLVRLDHPGQGNNFALQESDHLFVRQIPGYQLHRIVTIEGEVNFPGKYSLSKTNETLWNLLSRAGGFTDRAFPTGVVFKRKAIVADLERKNIDGIMRSSVPLVVDSTGAFKPVQMVTLDKENSDRIVIDIDRLLTSQGAVGDFSLQAGDSIYVPEIPSGISVLGEVCAKGTIKHQPNKKVKYYLEQAGGFTKRADKGDLRLVKANGRVYSSRNVMGQKVEIGDVIIVPTEIKKDHDWLKFVSTSLSILTGVATSVLIINKL